MDYAWGWALSAALAAALGSYLFDALVRVAWRPRAIARSLRRQGVRGPDRRLFVGNLVEIKQLRAAAAGVELDAASHDFLPIVQPQFCKWIPLYGRVFLYWFGSTPNICVADLGMAKQLLGDRTGLFPKNIHPGVLRLLGKGLVLTDGDEWQRHKKVVHPAFNMNKLKMMTVTMVDCARAMVSGWEAKLARQGMKGSQVEMELSSQFEELTADVISKTAFGSSYREGKQVFEALTELQFIALSTFFSMQIPGFRYFPTKKNLKAWRLEKKVRSMLRQIIENRLAGKDEAGYGSDLLGLMLEDGAKNRLLTMDDIIDECKTFFFAGQETTSHLLSWAMFLLATHPDWQEKLRAEVLMVCGKDQAPTYDMIAKLKLVSDSVSAIASFSVSVMDASSKLHDAASSSVLPMGEPVPSGDAEAVQPSTPDPEEGGGGDRARRCHGAEGRDLDDPDRVDAPRQGGLGRRRRRVQPAEVRRRRGAPRRAALLLRRAAVVHRAELRHDRGQGRGRHDPAEVLLLALPKVRPRAHGRDHAAPEVRAPGDRRRGRRRVMLGCCAGQCAGLRY